MAVYEDIHRRFLQSFVYNPVKSQAEMSEIYELVCLELENTPPPQIGDVVDTVNSTIKKNTTLEIKSVFNELNGEKFYVAVNTTNLPWAKNTSPYSKNEQLLFKKIIDDIVRGEGNVSTIVCLNYSNQINMSKSDTSTSIQKFVSAGWFLEKKGRLYMGVRSAAELQPYVLEAYGDIVSHCPLCKQLIYWGQRCGGCTAVAHIHCIKKYFAITNERKCPACEVEWQNDTELHTSDDNDDD